MLSGRGDEVRVGGAGGLATGCGRTPVASQDMLPAVAEVELQTNALLRHVVGLERGGVVGMEAAGGGADLALAIGSSQIAGFYRRTRWMQLFVTEFWVSQPQVLLSGT